MLLPLPEVGCKIITEMMRGSLVWSDFSPRHDTTGPPDASTPLPHSLLPLHPPPPWFRLRYIVDWAVMTLIFRYVCADNQGEDDGQSGWRHTHDFIEAELERLSREKAGAMVRSFFF